MFKPPRVSKTSPLAHPRLSCHRIWAVRRYHLLIFSVPVSEPLHLRLTDPSRPLLLLDRYIYTAPSSLCQPCLTPSRLAAAHWPRLSYNLKAAVNHQHSVVNAPPLNHPTNVLAALNSLHLVVLEQGKRRLLAPALAPPVARVPQCNVLTALRNCRLRWRQSTTRGQAASAKRRKA
jgi:hypothetical protein